MLAAVLQSMNHIQYAFLQSLGMTWVSVLQSLGTSLQLNAYLFGWQPDSVGIPDPSAPSLPHPPSQP